jgi:hypothetical protein
MTNARPRQCSRLVVVGASNLARMALALLDAHRAATNGAVEMHTVLGRGRSFALPTRLLARGLDGILASPLWSSARTWSPAPTTALLSDVGNDLLYGVGPPRILAWVETTLQRLATLADRRIVVGLPLGAIARLGAARYLCVRSVLVPRCRLSLAAAVDGAQRLHAGLEVLAARHGATFLSPDANWYGFDPIHVRRRHWRTAGVAWLGAPAAALTTRCDTGWRRLAWLIAAPAERRWFGVPTTNAQPVLRFADGSSASAW